MPPVAWSLLFGPSHPSSLRTFRRLDNVSTRDFVEGLRVSRSGRKKKEGEIHATFWPEFWGFRYRRFKMCVFTACLSSLVVTSQLVWILAGQIAYFKLILYLTMSINKCCRTKIHGTVGNPIVSVSMSCNLVFFNVGEISIEKVTHTHKPRRRKVQLPVSLLDV